MTGSLHGLRILDLTRFVAGPHCSMLLGDFGADVVKVEKPGEGDPMRGPDAHLGKDKLYMTMFNRNKRSVTLDLRNPRGQEVLRELARHADVLLENFRPGTLEKMGCGWDVLSRINPRLIVARISGFGQEGPFAHRPAFDAIGQAMGGLMEITGQPGGPPTMAGSIIIDYTTALHATVGILAALQARERTGRGQVVETTLLDTAVSFLMTAIPEYLLEGKAMTRRGNRDRYGAPSNTFQTADGVWIHIMGGLDEQFARLCRAMGAEHLAGDPRFAEGQARLDHAAELEAYICEWAKALRADQVLAALEAADLPFAKVATVADVVNNPQLRHRGQIVEIEHPALGKVPMQGNPIRLSATPTEIRLPVPTLGQHTEEVLGSWLGYGPDEMEELRRAGVV